LVAERQRHAFGGTLSFLSAARRRFEQLVGGRASDEPAGD
jgi:hypothetical protein